MSVRNATAACVEEKKIPHIQPGPLCGSSSPLSPFEPARVVRPN